MDPVTVTIVSALAAGAAAAAKDVATDAIKNAYAGLKRLITERYERAVPFVEAVAAEPTSKPEQEVLARQLDQVEAAQDQDLKMLAERLLDAIQDLRADPKAVALFDFDQLQLTRDAHFKNIDAAQVLRVRGKAEIGRDLIGEDIHQQPSVDQREKH